METDYASVPLPKGWDQIHTCRFLNYLDDFHGSDSDAPAFGYVEGETAYCDDLVTLVMAVNAALEG